MKCNNGKQSKCNEVVVGLNPEEYFTAANINELQAVFASMNDDMLNEIYSNLGI